MDIKKYRFIVLSIDLFYMLFIYYLVDRNLELFYLSGELTFSYHYEISLLMSSNVSFLKVVFV